MKVFISHSSKDQWVARRISEDLCKLGCETFLDEKDFDTGASIDEQIRENLSSTDDFLILLTPASVGSEWVLIELGGALALKKNIIPIMLYVGVNDLPKAIALKLARAITDIDKYYAEVASRLGKAPPRTRTTAQRGQAPKAPRFQIGDRIAIVNKRPKDDAYAGWVGDMDEFLGERATITDALQLDPAFTVYRLDVDSGEWLWLGNWLSIDKRRRKLG